MPSPNQPSEVKKKGGDRSDKPTDLPQLLQVSVATVSGRTSGSLDRTRTGFHTVLRSYGRLGKPDAPRIALRPLPLTERAPASTPFSVATVVSVATVSGRGSALLKATIIPIPIIHRTAGRI